jgi:hypothetical protein
MLSPVEDDQVISIEAAAASRGVTGAGAGGGGASGAGASGCAGVSSLDLARAVRTLGSVVREAGLVVPVFRSPPRVAELDRTIRRNHDGSYVVSVRLTGRPFVAVEADLIEGVMVANQLGGVEASRWRRLLWNALELGEARSAA